LQTTPELKAKYQEKAAAMETGAEKFGDEGDRKVRLVQDHPVYGGMVEAMDSAVGEVMDGLKEQGLWENTIIFFMSDNGGLSTSEGSPTSNLPLRAGKGWLYEGGIREPMLIRWPGVGPEGGACDIPVISTDFYPTILEMAGLDLHPAWHADGVSLCPLLRGEPDQTALRDRPLYWHYPHYGNQGGSPSSAVRAGNFKLIEFFEDGRVELYNLARDIGEKTNLADARPRRTKRMLNRLRAWQQNIGARFPSPNIPPEPQSAPDEG
jgi:arylsulfatase A-like enzyme